MSLVLSDCLTFASLSSRSGGSGGVVWRIRACNTRLVCAVGSRNGTEETKLLVLDFDSESTYENAERNERSQSRLVYTPPGLPLATSSDDEDELMEQLMEPSASGSSSQSALDAFMCEN